MIYTFNNVSVTNNTSAVTRVGWVRYFSTLFQLRFLINKSVVLSKASFDIGRNTSRVHSPLKHHVAVESIPTVAVRDIPIYRKEFFSHKIYAINH